LKGIYKITILLLAIVVLAACSRKKNSFVNRSFHSVTAEYNALYNGDNAFSDAKMQLAAGYRDNFWEILPVERINLDESQIALPSIKGSGGDKQDATGFARAEEKAAKAIQKHAMYIDGKEYNPQMDEAYILLGKSRYFDQRFVPALDAFNFVLNRYPTSNNINNAKVWKAKTNIRLNNEDLALENLQKILDQEDNDIKDEDLADITAIMAQAHIRLDSLDQALPFIKIASKTVRDNELKGRYSYIKGQLYDRLGQRDSANLAYDEVIELNRKSPRVYMINAYIAKAKNFDYDKEDRIAFLELLQDLEADRENRPFLDKIYNQIGEYYRNNDSIASATDYYNKSIKAYNNDGYLQSVNYTTLAEINFERALYKDAGAYYDSTLAFLEEKSRDWRRTTKKRENLDDVIKYEDIAIRNDSILQLAGMSDTEKVAYFNTYINKLKEEATKDSLALVSNVRGIANKEFFDANKKGGDTQKGGPFYFYNPTTVSYGKQEFKKQWGDRRLEDNWRRSAKRDSGIEEEEVEVVENKIDASERFDAQAYISRIPTDQVVLDSLSKDRNFAYYQLGLIYKEKFRENTLAINRLEKLLTFNPEERLVLPAKYNLYKLYDLTKNEMLAAQYKNDIITNHADSRYAEILLNPDKMLATDESSPEFKYKELYKKFETSQYGEVISKSDEYIVAYTGDPIVPKFEMLKATALAREQGFEAYKAALNNVALDYPNKVEGKQAQNILDTVLPGIANTDFTADAESDKWKVIYSFTVSERQAATDLKATLDKALKDMNYIELSTSLDYYNPTTLFVIIHGLNSKMGSSGFSEILKDKKKPYKITRPYTEISSQNYKIIQIHKNFEAYKNRDTK
jgi:tetratricopeptide (TPR) repeat protein